MPPGRSYVKDRRRCAPALPSLADACSSPAAAAASSGARTARRRSRRRRVVADAEAAATTPTRCTSRELVSRDAIARPPLVARQGGKGLDVDQRRSRSTSSGRRHALYIKGERRVLTSTFAGGAVAQLLHGRWLKAPAAHGQLASTRAADEHRRRSSHAISLSTARLRARARRRIDGQTGRREIRDTSTGANALRRGDAERPTRSRSSARSRASPGTITFDDWNRTCRSPPPKRRPSTSRS